MYAVPAPGPFTVPLQILGDDAHKIEAALREVQEELKKIPTGQTTAARSKEEEFQLKMPLAIINLRTVMRTEVIMRVEDLYGSVSNDALRSLLKGGGDSPVRLPDKGDPDLGLILGSANGILLRSPLLKSPLSHSLAKRRFVPEALRAALWDLQSLTELLKAIGPFQEQSIAKSLFRVKKLYEKAQALVEKADRMHRQVLIEARGPFSMPFRIHRLDAHDIARALHKVQAELERRPSEQTTTAHSEKDELDMKAPLIKLKAVMREEVIERVENLYGSLLKEELDALLDGKKKTALPAYLMRMTQIRDSS
ncbi:uncharacterized protein JCM15063_004774 [Sporobolomyces koalae]|uniref:uncharacterized protein n=1 Tax=Sporobolomyces koalae TaxID=500713 RepID=UPI003173AC8C